MKLIIWRPCYQPFICGGDVNAPLGCEIEVKKPTRLGKGMFGYLINFPDGRTRVAEAITGAIIGDTIEEVMIDVESAKPEVMDKQIEEAAEHIARHKPFTVKIEEFLDYKK